MTMAKDQNKIIKKQRCKKMHPDARLKKNLNLFRFSGSGSLLGFDSRKTEKEALEGLESHEGN